jgi:23S rRNA G2445 N2-methylase RlmL
MENNPIKGVAIVSKGIEQIAALEIKELIGVKTIVEESCVLFDCSYEDLCLLCYKAQSVNKILLLFSSFKEIDDIKKEVDKIDFSKWLDKDKTFRVSCKVIENKVSSQEINPEVGAFVIDAIKRKKNYEQKVDLDNPDVIFFVYIFKDSCYLGIDFSGFSLHKRSYKIFNHPRSLRGTIAYSLVRMADVDKNQVLIDPFCGSGEIPIEAALFLSGFPVNYFSKEKFAFLKLDLGINYEDFFKKIDGKVKADKLNVTGYDDKWLYLNNAKKNSKIAGINKLISLSRLESEWIDTKFEKCSVDKIVTQPPQISSHVNPKDVEKRYDELFYHAEFVLRENGLVVVISRKTDELKKFAEKYKFKVKEEKEVYSGKGVLKVVVFGK